MHKRALYRIVYFYFLAIPSIRGIVTDNQTNYCQSNINIYRSLYWIYQRNNSLISTNLQATVIHWDLVHFTNPPLFVYISPSWPYLTQADPIAQTLTDPGRESLRILHINQHFVNLSNHTPLFWYCILFFHIYDTLIHTYTVNIIWKLHSP